MTFQLCIGFIPQYSQQSSTRATIEAYISSAGRQALGLGALWFLGRDERCVGTHVADVLGDLDGIRVQLLADFLIQPVGRRNLHHLRQASMYRAMYRAIYRAMCRAMYRAMCGAMYRAMYRSMYRSMYRAMCRVMCRAIYRAMYRARLSSFSIRPNPSE